MANNRARACIYDINGKEIVGFKVFSVTSEAPARIIGAPIETGQMSMDNKVIDPMTIVVKGEIVIDGSEGPVFDKLVEMIDSRQFKFYKVCDGARMYNNLAMENKTINRDVEGYDFAHVTLKYKQIMLVQTSSSKPSNSEDSDTRKNGYADGVKQ